MKKIVIIILVLVLLLVAGIAIYFYCKTTSSEEIYPTLDESLNRLEERGLAIDDDLQQWIAENRVIPDPLPEHVPGSIELLPAEAFQEIFYLSYVPIHRAAFYSMSGDFEIVFGQIDDSDIYYYLPDAPPTMLLMNFILAHRIPQYQIVEVIERLVQAHISLGRDTNHEWDELPNADIIYTFDPEIISYFYRRQ